MVQAITDVTVRINVLEPQSVVGLGNPAIFVSGIAAGIETFGSLSSLEETYDINTSVHQKAKAIFAQANKPEKVAVVTYPESGIVSAATEFFFEDWHFALLADFNATDALALSNFIEEQNFKFLVVQVAAASELEPLSGNQLTIGVVHANEGQHLDAALVGDAANATVGSLTWKFRQNLNGITPVKLTHGDLEAIHNAGGIAYVEKAGIPQTSEGKTLGGEYIDALHGDHWIKSSIESSLQTLLSNTDKVTFDTNGIALLESDLTRVFERGFSNGVIDRDDETGEGNYTITALQRADLDPADIAARNYKGLSFRYRRSGAIHAVDVSGTVEV